MSLFHCSVVTGASEGIGRGYALEVRTVAGTSYHDHLPTHTVGQTRTECGSYEQISRETGQSGH